MDKSTVEYWGIPKKEKIPDIAVKGMDNRAKCLVNDLKETNNGTGDRSWVEGLSRNIDDKLGFKKSLNKAESMIGKSLTGIGADMGSGMGTLASILSHFDEVKKIYAVEASKGHVDLIMPKVFDLLDVKSEKIVRCHGSFNYTKFEDNSLDFVVELGSFHHSFKDLKTVTLKEMRRILKPGGIIISIERAKADKISDKDINKILNKKAKDFHYNFKDKSVTRGEWGEHEYRYREWKEAFTSNGFDIKTIEKRGFAPGKQNLLIVGELKK